MSKKTFSLFFPLCLSILSACNQQQDNCESTPAPTAQLQSKVIVGDLDWQEIIDIGASTPERENSYAIGELSIPVIRATCTGFLIAPDVVMTNNHCVSKTSEAKGVKITLMKEKGVPMEKWWKYDCGELIGTNFQMDVSLLRCSGRPGDTFGTVELEEDIYLHDPIYVIQQNCNYYADPYCSSWKKIARGQVQLITNEIKHNADTLGGSSGSPVFSSAFHQVVALHHAGQDLNSQTGQGSANYAVPMKGILAFIKSNYPQIELGKIAPKGEIMGNPSTPSNPTPVPTVAATSTPSSTPTAIPTLTTPTLPGGKPCVSSSK